MPELLQTYSIEQIIIFIVILAIAVKSCIDFFDWVKNRFDGMIKNKERKNKVDKVEQRHIRDMETLMKIQDEQNKAIDELTKSVNLLLVSDKDEIKAWITEKHHYFVYELKYIDDYSLDCIEKRFAHYQDEGGNSFIEDLMNDIRSLPVASSPLGSVHNQDKK